MLFSISFCLYRAFFTHLISSNLSCNLCLRYYDQLGHFDKEMHANVSESILNISTVHLNGILTPHMSLSIETCIRRTSCIKRTLQLSRGCPLNTGFTVTKDLLNLHKKEKSWRILEVVVKRHRRGNSGNRPIQLKVIILKCILRLFSC